MGMSDNETQAALREEYKKILAKHGLDPESILTLPTALAYPFFHDLAEFFDQHSDESFQGVLDAMHAVHEELKQIPLPPAAKRWFGLRNGHARASRVVPSLFARANKQEQSFRNSSFGDAPRPRWNHAPRPQQKSHAATGNRSAFLSHTGQDTRSGDFATIVSEKLDTWQVANFFDAKSIKYGKEWKTVLEQNVTECSAFVCIYSESYPLRYWTMKELDWAIQSGRKILPLFPFNEKVEVNDDVCRKIRATLESKRDRLEEDGEDIDIVYRRWCDNLRHLASIQGVYNESTSKMNLTQFSDKVVSIIAQLVSNGEVESIQWDEEVEWNQWDGEVEWNQWSKHPEICPWSHWTTVAWSLWGYFENCLDAFCPWAVPSFLVWIPVHVPVYPLSFF